MGKNATRDVIVGTRITSAQARGARRLAKVNGLTLSEWIAKAIEEKIVHDAAEPERLAEFTEATEERLRAARRAAATVGGN